MSLREVPEGIPLLHPHRHGQSEDRSRGRGMVDVDSRVRGHELAPSLPGTEFARRDVPQLVPRLHFVLPPLGGFLPDGVGGWHGGVLGSDLGRGGDRCWCIGRGRGCVRGQHRGQGGCHQQCNGGTKPARARYSEPDPAPRNGVQQLARGGQGEHHPGQPTRQRQHPQRDPAVIGTQEQASPIDRPQVGRPTPAEQQPGYAQQQGDEQKGGGNCRCDSSHAGIPS